MLNDVINLDGKSCWDIRAGKGEIWMIRARIARDGALGFVAGGANRQPLTG